MRWLLPGVLLSASLAFAHDADLVVVRLEPGPQPGVLVETVTLTAATLALLAPIDADGDGALTQGDLDARARALRVGFWDEVPVQAGGHSCEWLEAKATLKEGFVELQAPVRCGEGELRQDFKILRVLPANYRVAFNAQPIGDEAGPRFAQGTFTTISVPREPPGGALVARASPNWLAGGALALLLLLGGGWAWRLRRRW